MRSISRTLPAAGLLGGIAFAGYIHHELGDEALTRMIRTYSVAVPALASYKFVQYVYDKIPRSLGLPVDEHALASRYESLHPTYAPRSEWTQQWAAFVRF
jgi:hypothetical protein